jgi:hypothetical protein
MVFGGIEVALRGSDESIHSNLLKGCLAGKENTSFLQDFRNVGNSNMTSPVIAPLPAREF